MMAVDSRGADGRPIFLGTGAPATADDLTTLGEHIYERGTRLIGSSAQREAYQYVVEGLEWQDTTDGHTYIANTALDWVQVGPRVLWSGGDYAGATQTFTLSESVMSQKSGIILCWSRYTGGAPSNTEFNYTTIPKSHVALFPGAAVSCPLARGYNSDRAEKYVYVWNASVTGHANNTAAPNNMYVLRHIIGF